MISIYTTARFETILLPYTLATATTKPTNMAMSIETTDKPRVTIAAFKNVGIKLTYLSNVVSQVFSIP